MNKINLLINWLKDYNKRHPEYGGYAGILIYDDGSASLQSTDILTQATYSIADLDLEEI